MYTYCSYYSKPDQQANVYTQIFRDVIFKDAVANSPSMKFSSSTFHWQSF